MQKAIVVRLSHSDVQRHVVGKKFNDVVPDVSTIMKGHSFPTYVGAKTTYIGGGWWHVFGEQKEVDAVIINLL